MQSTERLVLKIAKPNQRVLIVEDDSVTADLLTHHCSQHHIPSHRVRDGAEALRYLLEGTPLWNAVRSSGGAPAMSDDNLQTILSRANVLFFRFVFAPRQWPDPLGRNWTTLGFCLTLMWWPCPAGNSPKTKCAFFTLILQIYW